jgi:DNA-directed RNA polymerase subunit RPC12/RpoP
MINLETETTKISCPKCNSANCFQETHKVAANTVDSYLCMKCGFTSTSLNTPDSPYLKDFEETCPELFKDIKFVDNDRKIVWYPTVLNFPELGLIFPDGTDAFNWSWRAVPVKPVEESEKEKYPIPGQDGKYYETKADMESSKLFDQNDFNGACKYLKIIVE